MNPETPILAEKMISHAWAEDAEQVLECLKQGQDEGSITHETIEEQLRRVSCVSPDVTVTSCWPQDPFRRVVDSSTTTGMFVIHTTTGDVYSRLWCVYEMSEAVAERNQDFVCQMHSTQLIKKRLMKPAAKFMENSNRWLMALVVLYLVPLLSFTSVADQIEDLFAEFFTVITPAFSVHWTVMMVVMYRESKNFGVDTKNAQCSMAQDTEMITEHVNAHGGFEMLNSTVESLRQRALRWKYMQLMMSTTYRWVLLMIACLFAITIWTMMFNSDIFAVNEGVDAEEWEESWH